MILAVLCLVIEQLICIKVASSKGKNRDLLFLFASGASFLCPVHSWTSGEDLGGDILRHRCPFSQRINSNPACHIVKVRYVLGECLTGGGGVRF